MGSVSFSASGPLLLGGLGFAGQVDGLPRPVYHPRGLVELVSLLPGWLVLCPRHRSQTGPAGRTAGRSGVVCSMGC